MTRLFRVYQDGYDYNGTLKVFQDQAVAVEYARAQSRRYNEEFGGGIGNGVYIEILDGDSGDAARLEDWEDWEVEKKGGSIVLKARATTTP